MASSRTSKRRTAMVSTPGSEGLASRPGFRGKLSVYVRLTKAWMYYHWAPVVIAWSLLAPPLASNGRVLLVLGLFALATFAACSAGGVLDDVQGFADGIDQRSYAREEHLRSIRRKPIANREIGLREARRVGLALAVVAVALGICAVALAPYHQVWLLAVAIAAVVIGVQYSYGMRVSYVVGNEVVLGAATAIALAMPYLLITGRLTATALCQATLVALFMGQVTIFSNSADAEIDRDAGRMTVAARLSAARNRRFVVAAFICTWLFTVVCVIAGVLSVTVAIALLPCLFVQARQLKLGLAGQWLGGRALGWRAFDLGLLALLAGNVLHGP